MATTTVIQALDTTRPYIVYRPPSAPKLTGPIAVYLYTDGAQPDAFLDSMALGKRFAAFVPLATVGVTLEFRKAGGAALDQNSSNAEVRGALDRAVANIGWTSAVVTPT